MTKCYLCCSQIFSGENCGGGGGRAISGEVLNFLLKQVLETSNSHSHNQKGAVVPEHWIGEKILICTSCYDLGVCAWKSYEQVVKATEEYRKAQKKLVEGIWTGGENEDTGWRSLVSKKDYSLEEPVKILTKSGWKLDFEREQVDLCEVRIEETKQDEDITAGAWQRWPTSEGDTTITTCYPQSHRQTTNATAALLSLWMAAQQIESFSSDSNELPHSFQFGKPTSPEVSEARAVVHSQEKISTASSDRRRATVLSRFRCMFCKLTFSRRSVVCSHILHCHERHNFSNRCLEPDCSLKNFEFLTKVSLYKHFYTHHVQGLKCVCNICGKGFKTAGYVKRHQEAMHTVVRPFCCAICGRGFVEKRQLDTHVMKVHQR